MLDLNEIRNNIDKIDSQLVELFEERMKLTTRLQNIKLRQERKSLIQQERKLS